MSSERARRRSPAIQRLIKQLVDEAPPLSASQMAVIAGAFAAHTPENGRRSDDAAA